LAYRWCLCRFLRCRTRIRNGTKGQNCTWHRIWPVVFPWWCWRSGLSSIRWTDVSFSFISWWVASLPSFILVSISVEVLTFKAWKCRFGFSWLSSLRLLKTSMRIVCSISLSSPLSDYPHLTLRLIYSACLAQNRQNTYAHTYQSPQSVTLQCHSTFSWSGFSKSNQSPTFLARSSPLGMSWKSIPKSLTLLDRNPCEQSHVKTSSGFQLSDTFWPGQENRLSPIWQIRHEGTVSGFTSDPKR
jgi:hypothetical protein